MLFSRRRRRSGGGIMGAVLVALGLYATGAGDWLTDRIAQLPRACSVNFSGQQGFCDGVQTVTDVTVSAATIAGGVLDRVGGVVGNVSDYVSGGDNNVSAYGGGGHAYQEQRLPIEQLQQQLNVPGGAANPRVPSPHEITNTVTRQIKRSVPR